MKTREQVKLERIGLNFDLLTDRINAAVMNGTRSPEAAAQYQNRLVKARTLALDGKVQRKDDGSYLVRSQTFPNAIAYEVNGKCTCMDFETADKGWCKHRLAAYLTFLACNDIRTLMERTEGLPIPHDHTFTCGHNGDTYQCFDAACPEHVVGVTCPTCTTTIITTPTEKSLVTVHPDQDAMPEWEPETAPTFEDVLASLDEPGALTALSSSLPLTTAQYEPAPVLTPTAVPLAEAPASINLKFKLAGNHEMMLTLRGHEVLPILEQLPTVLAKLESVLQPTAQDPDHGWFHRISQAILPLSWRNKAANANNGYGQ